MNKSYLLTRVTKNSKINYHIRPVDEDDVRDPLARITVIDELEHEQIKYLNEDIKELVGPKIKTGKLRRDYLGYKINAEVIWIEGEKRFLLIRDSKDEYWGYALHTSKQPEIFDEIECLRIPNEERFWTLYRCIVQYGLKLPAIFNLD
jgi:hypothetical protein